MKRAVIGLAIAAGAAAGSVYLIGGRFALEKTAQAMFDPISAIWLALLFQSVLFFACGFKRAAMFSALAWFLLTLAGNQLVARYLIWTLEKPFADFRFDGLEPIPCAVVLGGSSGTSVSGDPQGGDRVLMAARLWHSKKISRIYASGSQFVITSQLDRHPAEETRLLLIQAGVPEDQIALNFGLNTFEEFRSLRDELAKEENPNSQKVGIISSAAHLRRATELARENGLNPVAIPASFSVMPYQPGPDLVIPSSGNLSAFQSFVHEYLGRLLGR